jgi:tRNA A-37 threonylcarbamoyl transferase component Bud32
MLGLLSAFAYPFLHYGTQALVPERILQANPVPPASFVAMWVAIVCGLAIYGLARMRKLRPDLMLDIGLLFEVVGALCIGLIEAPRFSGDKAIYYGGPGGIALWITVFVLVVPNTLGKTALAAFASALMGPIGVVVAAYANNQPLPAAFVFLVGSLPTEMSAVIAIILSRFVYSLGTDVSKAREMGSYKLVELLGQGGMGEVWRAEHRLLARPAAIKLIQPEVLGCRDSRETAIVKRRFEREAQATAMLSSPHTIHLYDFGQTEDGAFYYVMELLHGIDLQTLVEKYGPLPAERAAHFVLQICSSLEEAHHNGLIHRDIKPANIYTSRYGVEYDFVKVLDFGIVKSQAESDGQTQLTNANDASGTPGFMAPEMALGKDIDHRADLYAVGCVAYWLLTGRLVFEEETFLATLLAHAQRTPVPPSRRSEIEIPPSFDKLIMSCLEKEPERRPSNAREIIKTLSQSAVADSWTPERAEKWWRAHMPERSGPAAQPLTASPPLHVNAQAN